MPFGDDLIEAVKNFPNLYDASHEHHRDTIRSTKCWEIIGQRTGQDWNFCKGKWKQIREKFVRSKRLMKESEDVIGSKKVSTYKYYDKLSWLSPYIKHKVKDEDEHKSKAKVSNDESTSTFVVHESTYFGQELPNDTSASESPSMATTVVFPASSSTPSKQDTTYPKVVETFSTSKVLESDPDLSYINMVGSTLKSFSPRIKSLAKLKIQEVLYELEELEQTSRERQTFQGILNNGTPDVILGEGE